MSWEQIFSFTSTLLPVSPTWPPSVHFAIDHLKELSEKLKPDFHLGTRQSVSFDNRRCGYWHRKYNYSLLLFSDGFVLNPVQNKGKGRGLTFNYMCFSFKILNVYSSSSSNRVNKTFHFKPNVISESLFTSVLKDSLWLLSLPLSWGQVAFLDCTLTFIYHGGHCYQPIIYPLTVPTQL